MTYNQAAPAPIFDGHIQTIRFYLRAHPDQSSVPLAALARIAGLHPNSLTNPYLRPRLAQHGIAMTKRAGTWRLSLTSRDLEPIGAVLPAFIAALAAATTPPLDEDDDIPGYGDQT